VIAGGTTMLALARSALLLSLAAASGAALAAPVGAVPLPPPPAGTTALSSRTGRMVLVGGTAGFASKLGNGGDASAVIGVEASTPWRTTRSGLALTLAMPFRTFLPSKAEHGGLESGATGIELTPTLRASMPLGRSRASLRSEAGLGVVSRWTWEQVDVRYLGRQTQTGHTTTAIVRTGLAIDWALRPQLTVAFEPLSLGFDLEGNADWIFALGATYRL
jgi:hypothetical protein